MENAPESPYVGSIAELRFLGIKKFRGTISWSSSPIDCGFCRRQSVAREAKVGELPRILTAAVKN